MTRITTITAITAKIKRVMKKSGGFIFRNFIV